MFVYNVLPMFRPIPFGFVAITATFTNVKNFAIGGSTMKVHKEIHSGNYITPPLPWATPVA
jgi:hypothetical protein